MVRTISDPQRTLAGLQEKAAGRRGSFTVTIAAWPALEAGLPGSPAAD